LSSGRWCGRGASLDERLRRVHRLFPRLHERRDQCADTRSRDEQQMVAIGRGLVSRRGCCGWTMGFSRALVRQNFRIINDESEIAVLVVE
jgi:ABC-type branched-subunit amino acid transport system ATPase component